MYDQFIRRYITKYRCIYYIKYQHQLLKPIKERIIYNKYNKYGIQT